MTLVILSVLIRAAHLVAAMTMVGGAVFLRFVLLPHATPGTPALVDAARRRWALAVMVSIAVLLASGLYSYIVATRNYQLPSYYHMLFGIKFLMAMVIFFVTSALVGRQEATAVIRQNPRAWLTLNLILALAIVLVAGVMRIAPREPKRAGTPQAANAGLNDRAQWVFPAIVPAV